MNFFLAMMKEDEELKFYKKLLEHLHLDFLSFCKGVANEDRYELLIDSWIKQLYSQNKSIKDAKILITKLRHRQFFGKDEVNN